MIILIPLLVCIVGAFVYVVATNGKVAEIGRIAYAFGLLVTLLGVGQAVVTLLRR